MLNSLDCHLVITKVCLIKSTINSYKQYLIFKRIFFYFYETKCYFIFLYSELSRFHSKDENETIKIIHENYMVSEMIKISGKLTFHFYSDYIFPHRLRKIN